MMFRYHKGERSSRQRAPRDVGRAFTLLQRLPWTLSEAVNLLIGPQAGPDAHMAVSLRPSGSRPIRVTEDHL